MKKQEKAGNKMKLMLSCIFIVLLFILVIGTTYALFSYTKEGKIENTISTGSITFSYTESSNGILLQNAMPVSDEVGKKLDISQKNNGYFDFNVSSTISGTSKINYEIYATKISVDNELNEKYVKIYLTDGLTDNAISGYDSDIPTYYSLKESALEKNAKSLYYGTFNNTGIQYFRLRMWISDKYDIKDVSENFKIKVNVQAINS